MPKHFQFRNFAFFKLGLISLVLDSTGTHDFSQDESRPGTHHNYLQQNHSEPQKTGTGGFDREGLEANWKNGGLLGSPSIYFLPERGSI